MIRIAPLLLLLTGCGLLPAPETTIIERRVMLCPVIIADLDCTQYEGEKVKHCIEKEKAINAEARRQCGEVETK